MNDWAIIDVLLGGIGLFLSGGAAEVALYKQNIAVQTEKNIMKAQL